MLIRTRIAENGDRACHCGSRSGENTNSAVRRGIPALSGVSGKRMKELKVRLVVGEYFWLGKLTFDCNR